jgi:hypothetical protein
MSNKRERPTEARAEQYLKHSGFVDIESQPEGKDKFPDFLVNARIGVEVRRLQISKLHDGHVESAARSVCDNLRSLLSDLGPPINGVSWFVQAKFKLPLVKPLKLRRQIQDRLRLFQDVPLDQITLEVNATFRLSLIRASKTHSYRFLHGGYPGNVAYFVESERKKNLESCLEDKTKKHNKAVLTREYSQWWLIFEDHIGYGSPIEFSEQMRVQHDWDRVILFNPSDPTIFCELPSNKQAQDARIQATT